MFWKSDIKSYPKITKWENYVYALKIVMPKVTPSGIPNSCNNPKVPYILLQLL